MRHRVRGETILVGAAFLVLSAIVTLPVARHLATWLPENAGDPLGNAWMLAWGAERLPHLLRGYWQTPAFYPYNDSAAFSEPLLGVAVLVAPLQWIWHNPVLTYNVAFLLSFALTGLGTFLFVRRLTGSAPTAFVAGCAFAFSPYRANHLDHLQVLSVWWMPLAFLFLHDLLERGRIASALIFAAAFTLQALSSGYSVFYMSVGVALIVVFWLFSGRLTRPQVLTLLGVAVAGAALLLPVADRFYDVWRGHEPEVGVMMQSSADVTSLLAVRHELFLARWLHGARASEINLFPGLGLSLLAAIGLVWPGPDRRLARLYAAIAVVALLLAFGPVPQAWGHPIAPVGPYTLFAKIVPLSNLIRVPARFWMLLLLALAVLSALGLRHLLAGRPPRVQWIAAAVIGLAVTTEGWVRPIRLIPPPKVDAPVYTWLATQPPGALLELPIAFLGKTHDAMRAQYASLRHGHPIVNGMSRTIPPLITLLDWSASPLTDPTRAREVLPLLSGLHVRYVLVRPETYLDPGLAQATIDAFMQDRIYVDSSRQFGDSFMFTVRPSDTPVPSASELRRVPASAITVDASHWSDRAKRVLDGNLDTIWFSRAQAGGEWFSLTFDHPRDVAVLRITTTTLSDYPRDLEVIGIVDGAPGPTLFRGSVLGALGSAIRLNPNRPEMALTLPANHVDGLRLVQHGNGGIWTWSMNEVAVDERAGHGTPAATSR